MKRIAWIALGCLASLTTVVQAASFDCAKAASKVEKLICGSDRLTELDDLLDKAYKDAKASSSPEEAKHLVSDQIQWLKEKRNACVDEPCLMQAYSTRIETIKPVLGKSTRPLTKINSLESLPPVGHGFLGDIRQIDGNIVYSHYDNSGNTKNIVDFDFTSGRWFNWVEGKRDPKLIAYDSRYIVVHTPHSASFPIEVISRKTGASLSRIKLKSSVQEAFIEGDRLVLFQASAEPPYGYQQAIAIFKLPSLRLIQETSISGGILISLQGNRIFTAISANAADLMIYDHQFKELGRIKLPPPIDKVNSYCKPQIVQNDNDRAVLIANCGEMHILNLKSFSIERSIPRYSFFYSVALYKNLIFTTTEKQNGIVVFDMNSGTEIAQLPIPASYLFIKGDALLAAETPVSHSKDSSWPMQAYRVNADLIRSGEWMSQSVIDVCSQSSQATQNGGDIYEAVRLCGNSGINVVINSGNVPTDTLPYALNYATWLSQTLHRYDESLALFGKLHKYGASLGSEAIKEATLKRNVFGSVESLGGLKTDSNGTFSRALRLGLSQKPVQTLQLPKLDNDIKFIGEYAYVNSWDCYPVAGQGVGIEVFSRNTLKHLTRLFIRECDDEQQDNVGSIIDDKGKLHVLTEFRYPDKKRRNYFVFDKKTWKLIKSGIYSEANNEIKFSLEDNNQEENLATKSYQMHREYVTSTVPGQTKYSFSRKGAGNNPVKVVASFSLKGTSSTPIIIPDMDEVIFIGNPDDLGRLSIIHFDPVTSRSVTFATLPTIAAWAVDDSYFYVSNGIDIMIFDLADQTLKCLIPRAFWTDNDGLQSIEHSQERRHDSGAPAETRSSNEKQINKIYLDRNRLIVRTLYGASLVYDIPPKWGSKQRTH